MQVLARIDQVIFGHITPC